MGEVGVVGVGRSDGWGCRSCGEVVVRVVDEIVGVVGEVVGVVGR